jgi:serine acetyltransferase
LNNRDAHNMPSTRAVAQICHDLLQLLFPGFHDDDAVHHGSLAELIGKSVKLDHGVTLGARSFAKDEAGHIVKGGKRHPNVEDNVTIYPNSTILGGETVIGANSTIGANVFLMHSVPPDSLVVYEEKQLVIRDKSAWKIENFDRII